jgi:hypothetical protein
MNIHSYSHRHCSHLSREHRLIGFAGQATPEVPSKKPSEKPKETKWKLNTLLAAMGVSPGIRTGLDVLRSSIIGGGEETESDVAARTTTEAMEEHQRPPARRDAEKVAEEGNEEAKKGWLPQPVDELIGWSKSSPSGKVLKGAAIVAAGVGGFVILRSLWRAIRGKKKTEQKGLLSSIPKVLLIPFAGVLAYFGYKAVEPYFQKGAETAGFLGGIANAIQHPVQTVAGLFGGKKDLETDDDGTSGGITLDAGSGALTSQEVAKQTISAIDNSSQSIEQIRSVLAAELAKASRQNDADQAALKEVADLARDAESVDTLRQQLVDLVGPPEKKRDAEGILEGIGFGTFNGYLDVKEVLGTGFDILIEGSYSFELLQSWGSGEITKGEFFAYILPCLLLGDSYSLVMDGANLLLVSGEKIVTLTGSFWYELFMYAKTEDADAGELMSTWINGVMVFAVGLGALKTYERLRFGMKETLVWSAADVALWPVTVPGRVLRPVVQEDSASRAGYSRFARSAQRVFLQIPGRRFFKPTPGGLRARARNATLQQRNLDNADARDIPKIGAYKVAYNKAANELLYYVQSLPESEIPQWFLEAHKEARGKDAEISELNEKLIKRVIVKLPIFSKKGRNVLRDKAKAEYAKLQAAGDAATQAQKDAFDEARAKLEDRYPGAWDGLSEAKRKKQQKAMLENEVTDAYQNMQDENASTGSITQETQKDFDDAQSALEAAHPGAVEEWEKDLAQHMLREKDRAAFEKKLDEAFQKAKTENENSGTVSPETEQELQDAMNDLRAAHPGAAHAWEQRLARGERGGEGGPAEAPSAPEATPPTLDQCAQRAETLEVRIEGTQRILRTLVDVEGLDGNDSEVTQILAVADVVPSGALETVLSEVTSIENDLVQLRADTAQAEDMEGADRAQIENTLDLVLQDVGDTKAICELLARVNSGEDAQVVIDELNESAASEEDVEATDETVVSEVEETTVETNEDASQRAMERDTLDSVSSALNKSLERLDEIQEKMESDSDVSDIRSDLLEVYELTRVIVIDPSELQHFTSEAEVLQQRQSDLLGTIQTQLNAFGDADTEQNTPTVSEDTTTDSEQVFDATIVPGPPPLSRARKSGPPPLPENRRRNPQPPPRPGPEGSGVPDRSSPKPPFSGESSREGAPPVDPRFRSNDITMPAPGAVDIGDNLDTKSQEQDEDFRTAGLDTGKKDTKNRRGGDTDSSTDIKIK